MKTSLITVKPGQKLRLRDVNPGDTGSHASKDDAAARAEKLRPRLAELQERLYGESKQSLLIVLQAIDTGGKDGTTKNLLTGINPAGVQVTSFKAPTPIELAHDFLWRVHAVTPARGYIGVWNRSHYEDVLVTRVHKIVPEKVWRTRYDDINAFEKLLVDNGTTLVKIFLCISKDEQKARLQKRLDRPEKRWKFSENDLKERALWDDYMAAYEGMLQHCSTPRAPWHVVPADHKWARDAAVLEKVVATLEGMNPHYPKASLDTTSITIT